MPAILAFLTALIADTPEIIEAVQKILDEAKGKTVAPAVSFAQSSAAEEAKLEAESKK